MVRKIYYSNLDIWKFISAVFVVFLHTVNISTLHGKAEITMGAVKWETNMQT